MKNQFKIKDFKEWKLAYYTYGRDMKRDDLFIIQNRFLDESKLIWYNKKHFKRESRLLTSEELDKIKTYVDALLHKDSRSSVIRQLCGYIIKGDIVI